MSVILNDFLKQLDLKPGESRSIAVDDYEVEIRRRPWAIDDPGPMINLWLDVPPSENAKTIVLRRGEPDYPKPIVITEADLAPE